MGLLGNGDSVVSELVTGGASELVTGSGDLVTNGAGELVTGGVKEIVTGGHSLSDLLRRRTKGHKSR